MKQKTKQFFFLISFFILFILSAFFSSPILAQDLSLAPEELTDPRTISGVKTISLIAARLFLAAIAVIGAVFAIDGAFKWRYSDGYAQKAYDGKRRFALWVLILTIDFLLLSLFHYYVPDLSVLIL